MGTEFRYPDDFNEIDDVTQLFSSIEEVEAAITQAKRILVLFNRNSPKNEITIY